MKNPEATEQQQQATGLVGGDVDFHDTDYKGRKYAHFFARRSPGYGPGWYVYGRNPEYGGHLVHLCAQPNVKPRRHPHYNAEVRRGWGTRKAAQAVAEQLNRG